MIKSIFIKNFLLLKDMKIDFSNDCVISGESGSGKSIIIKAVAYLFCLYENSIADVKGDVIINDTAYVIHRTNNEYYINNHKVTKNSYMSLVSNKLEVIDQNFSNRIFDIKNHINIVDSFIDIRLKDDLRSSYKLLLKANKKVKKLENYISSFDYEYTLFQLEELKKLDINSEEYDALIKRFNDIKKEVEYNEKFKECCKTLIENNVIFIIEDVISKLIKIDRRFNDYENIYELNNDIHKCYKEINSDDLLLKDKIDSINYLLHKYNKNCNELLKHRDKLINDFKYYHEARELLTTQLEVLSVEKKRYDTLSYDIHNERVNIIKTIEEKFSEQISKLGMNKCKMRIDIINAKNTSVTGNDVVSILIDVNGMQEYKSIADKISGGEMSRVIFVLTSILIQQSNISTLILDEIDTGLSGQNSIQLAKQIKNICSEVQLICISHSPITCCFSNNHYYVNKEANCIDIKKLNSHELLERIAFLSNININQDTIINASNIIKIIQELPS